MVTRKMRMLAASLALVMCVSLYSVPRAKAVATEVAVGTAAVASYFQATGLTMAASAGSTGALITTGVADIAGSYAMATGAASSGSAFLSSVAAGVSISTAGAIVLTATAVVAIGALVAWYIHENGLEEGSEVVAVPGSGLHLSNGLSLPALPDWDAVTYPYACICPSLGSSGAYELVVVSSSFLSDGGCLRFSGYCKYRMYTCSNGVWGGPSTIYTINKANTVSLEPLWANFDVYSTDGSLYLAGSAPTADGQLVVSRGAEFSQPDQTVEPDSLKQMVIDAGFSPGVTLDTVAEEVPNLLAAGTLVPTYEITTIEPDTGTDTDPEEETGIYIPVLSDIKTRLDTLGDSIADKIMTGLQSLFVPDEAFFAEAVPELQETFQGRMGLLTFPISLLADFLGRLSNLGDQPPILTWGSVSIYGTELIAAGSYNLRDALKSAPVHNMYTIYMVVVNASLIFAFLALCHSKYRKIMQN